jgi:hypothetical protein
MKLRLQPSAAVRERRLERLLAERGLRRDDARLTSLVEDALVVGSLELSGVRVEWETARAARLADADAGPPELRALRAARAAVAPTAPVTLDAIRAWHEALAGPLGFRRGEVELRHSQPDGGGPQPKAPVAFIESRLDSLAEWLEAPGSAALKAEE